MEFSELMRAAREHPQAVVVPAVWGQGRAAFGGVAAGLVYTAMRQAVPADRPVRSLAITFVGPMSVDQPVSLEVEILRQGKSVSQVLGRAVQDGQVVTLIQGSFGAGRESEVYVHSTPAPAMKPLEDCIEFPYVEGRLPPFVRYLAMRWGEGQPPGTGSKGRSIGGWVRLRDSVTEPLNEAHMLALVDAWPPATLSNLTRRAPSSSVTWTIEFIQPRAELSTDDWCLYRAEIEHASQGYGHIAAGFWDNQGELIAISRQTVALFG
jgi:acyl-CoA thioesterase